MGFCTPETGCRRRATCPHIVYIEINFPYLFLQIRDCGGFVVVKYGPKHRGDGRGALFLYVNQMQNFREYVYYRYNLSSYRCILRGTLVPADRIPIRPSIYPHYRDCGWNATSHVCEACRHLVSLTWLWRETCFYLLLLQHAFSVSRRPIVCQDRHIMC